MTHYLHVLLNLFHILVSTSLTEFLGSLWSLDSSETPSTGEWPTTRTGWSNSTSVSRKHLFFPRFHTTVYWITDFWYTLYTDRNHMKFHFITGFFVLIHTSPQKYTSIKKLNSQKILRDLKIWYFFYVWNITRFKNPLSQSSLVYHHITSPSKQ